MSTKSAYQRGREAALQELEQFLEDSTNIARARLAESNEGKLASERYGAYDRGVFAGAVVANETLLKVIRAGAGPKVLSS